MESIKYGERQRQSSLQPLLLVNSTRIIIYTGANGKWGDYSNKKIPYEITTRFFEQNHWKID